MPEHYEQQVGGDVSSDNPKCSSYGWWQVRAADCSKPYFGHASNLQCAE